MRMTIKNRSGKKIEWETINPVLALGEFGFDIDSYAVKIGNGVDCWNDLGYLAIGEKPKHKGFKRQVR